MSINVSWQHPLSKCGIPADSNPLANDWQLINTHYVWLMVITRQMCVVIIYVSSSYGSCHQEKLTVRHYLCYCCWNQCLYVLIIHVLNSFICLTISQLYWLCPLKNTPKSRERPYQGHTKTNPVQLYVAYPCSVSVTLGDYPDSRSPSAVPSHSSFLIYL